MNDDTELLRRYLDERSESAFTELVQQHITLVYSVALRQVNGDAHLAEDVVQNVFTALALKAHSLRHHATLTGWLYVGTHHAAAALVRSEQRRKIRETRAEAMTSSISTSSEPNYSDLRPAIDEALVELRPEDRDALVLRFFEQRSFANIGSLLRTSEDAARKRVDRALDRLRSVLLRRGITSSAAVLSGVLGTFAIISAPSRLAAQVAGQAFAQATATGTAGSATAVALKVIPMAAAVMAGTWLVVSQSQANAGLRAERDALRARVSDLVSLQAGNDRLRARIRETEVLLGAAATHASATAATPAPAAGRGRPAFAQVLLTPQATIKWNGTGVTLADFVTRLSNAGADPAFAEARLVVRAPDTPFSALSYILDEACKAHVKHVVVESNSQPLPDQGVDTWF